MINEETHTLECAGIVKWFDPKRGFGFVVSDDVSSDILLHVNVLKKFGQSSIVEGAQIDLIVAISDKGAQAVDVVSIEAPSLAHLPQLDDFESLTSDGLGQMPLEPARVKWFDAAKGFGFCNVFGSKLDVFLHAEVLRFNGLTDVMPGEAVAVKVFRAKRGLMACEIKAWDMVTSEEPSLSS